MESGGDDAHRWWHSHMVVGALAVGGTVLGVETTRIAAYDVHAVVFRVAIHALSGTLFLVAGMAAHYRRPDNPVGVLMELVGIGFFSEDLQLSHSALIHTIGQLTVAGSSGFLVHLALAFPTGRLGSFAERAIVITAYAIVMVTGLVDALFMDWPLGHPDDARGLLLITSAPGAATVSKFLTHILAILVSVGVASVLGRRWLGASPLLRRLLAPVIGVLLVGTVVSAVGEALDYRPLHDSLIEVYDVCFAALPLAFLIGMTRLYLGRSTVGRLLMQLRGPMAVGDLREVLARELGDSSLQVAFRTETDLVDASGGPLPPAGRAGARAVTAVCRVDEREAVLVHDPLLTEDRHVLASVAAAAGLALTNRALTDQVARQLAEVQASRTRIVAAADAQRRQIERNLHDGAQQRLVTTMLGVRLAQRRLAGYGTEAAAALDGVAEDLMTALAEIRELARGLHPAILTEDGLVAAVEALVQRLPVPVDVDVVTDPGATAAATGSADQASDILSATGPARRLPAAVESTGYYVVAEALTNALKHARAEHIRVLIHQSADRLSVRVSDDGAGGADLAAGGGLLGLRDRVDALGGRFELTSPPGHGTVVEAVLTVEP
ncbi:MAG TPA: ATP-binding protein [Actinocrinis sp.]|nr:ATP-binding protein [Actinocrinis sp.]